MSVTISEAILQALDAAGGQGLTLDELHVAANALCDRSIRRPAVSNAVGELRATKRAEILSRPAGLSRHYTLIARHGPEAFRERVRYRPDLHLVDEVFQPVPVLPAPLSITAAVCGDPLPGRSALDRRLAAQA